MAIVVARYHTEITSRLREGAIAAYQQHFGQTDTLIIREVPGAFEIPYMVSTLAELTPVSGVVALGCIVKGETSHDRVLGEAVTSGLAQISMDGIPVGLGVLTVDSIEQARERSGGSLGNKGADAMNAAIELWEATESLLDSMNVGTNDDGEVSRFLLPHHVGHSKNSTLSDSRSTAPFLPKLQSIKSARAKPKKTRI